MSTNTPQQRNPSEMRKIAITVLGGICTVVSAVIAVRSAEPAVTVFSVVSGIATIWTAFSPAVKTSLLRNIRKIVRFVTRHIFTLSSPRQDVELGVMGSGHAVPAWQEPESILKTRPFRMRPVTPIAVPRRPYEIERHLVWPDTYPTLATASSSSVISEKEEELDFHSPVGQTGTDRLRFSHPVRSLRSESPFSGSDSILPGTMRSHDAYDDWLREQLFRAVADSNHFRIFSGEYSPDNVPHFLTPDDMNGPIPLQEATRSIPPWISSAYSPLSTTREPQDFGEGAPFRDYVLMTPVQPLMEATLSDASHASDPTVGMDVDEDLLSPNMLGLKIFDDDVPGF
ncbi:hypothetical protein VNI00_008117 [Paramarasmius palmivorus]|uniref:Uncharacterized protein n=1 Tax=Paramarasmius palmivorus TaxID=297713 RepID=A0AAW0CYN4_9AGAR